MSEQGTEFLNISPESKTTRSVVKKVENGTPLEIEGVGGKKKFVTIEMSSEKRGRRPVFFSKEYLTEKVAKDTAALFAKLRRDGFPVPPTTRFYKMDDKFYLLITDMTEGGKYPVWTFSGGPNADKAGEKLKQINPTREELESKLTQLTNRLTELGYYASCDVYSLRRVNGELQLFLLDVVANEMFVIPTDEIPKFRQSLEEHNQRHREVLLKKIFQESLET